MTVAIVGGTGDLGFGLAVRLTASGQPVVIGSRVAERAAEAARRVREAVGPNAPVEGAENPEAVSGVDLAFVTVPYAGQAATYKTLRDHWADGTIVCDTTSPLATAVGGAPTQVLRPWQGSAAEQAASSLPDHVRLASGFHSVGAESLEELDRPVEGDVLLCGNDADAKVAVGDLVERIGMRWVDCGPLTMARILEPLTAVMIRVNRSYGLRETGVRLSGRDAWGRPPG